MKYRLLDQSEWDRLTTLVDPKFIPSPESAAAAVAEDDQGKILGVLFMQLAIHMEPLILLSPKVSFENLYNVLYTSVSDRSGLKFYAFSDREVVSKMAVHVGMERTDYEVFEGTVK